MQNHTYILLMAGGSGTRLYPASREATPKHLSKIIGDKTFLQQTFSRAAKIVSPDHIYISTNEKYIDQILKQLPELKKDQIIAEPEKRNTAPALALSSMIISHKDPSAVIAAISCDHQILKEHSFVSTFKAGLETISKMPDSIMILGIQPDSPHLGYEYIEKDEVIEEQNKFAVSKVKRFVERPSDREAAKKYIDLGYYWNAGYFIFSGKYFLDQVRQFLPSVSEGLDKIEGVIEKNNFDQVLRKEFLKFPDAQVDKSIITKIKNLLVLPADLGWCDVGSWDVVTDLIEDKKKDENGNYSEQPHVFIDSHNTMILGNGNRKLIATIGLSNITIVDTGDVFLVMEKGRGQEVKKIVEELKKRKMEELL